MTYPLFDPVTPGSRTRIVMAPPDAGGAATRGAGDGDGAGIVNETRAVA